jgi:hypothetical protein
MTANPIWQRVAPTHVGMVRWVTCSSEVVVNTIAVEVGLAVQRTQGAMMASFSRVHTPGVTSHAVLPTSRGAASRLPARRSPSVRAEGHQGKLPSVLITGASTGIGRAAAVHLATEGWCVSSPPACDCAAACQTLDLG